MFFLGIIQLVWALIHLIVTKRPEVRRHFAFYWLGVTVYGITLTTWTYIYSLNHIRVDAFSYLYYAFFFIGALSLAVYHVLIVTTKGLFGRPDQSEIEAEIERWEQPLDQEYR